MKFPHLTVTEFLVGSLIVVIVVFTCRDLTRKIKFGKRYGTNTLVLPYIPLIGSAYRFLLESPLDTILDLCKDYTSFYVWIFKEPHYVTCDPDELRIILTHRNSVEKGSAYSLLKPVLHNALILIPVAVWKNTRKNFSVLFKQRVIDGYLPSFNETTDEYIRTIGNEENTADLEYKNTELFIDHFFQNFIKFEQNEKLQGLRSGYKSNELSKLFLASVAHRMLNPLCYFDCIFNLTSVGNKYFRTHDLLEQFFTEVIQSRRMKKMDPGYSEEIDGPSLIDIMDEGGMDFQNMLGNLLLFSGAAGEASGKVLTYAMVVLGLYKDIQKNVYEEVIGATGSDGMIDSAALNNMKYTEMVLLETMRIFTPIPSIARQVTEDLELKGRTISKGTNIFVSLIALHRNEKYWKDPKKFDPNRFSKEEVKNRHPYSYAPFSAGPRNCIGWKYANMIGTTVLGKVVRKYKISCNLESLEEIKLKSYISLDVPEDIRITFTPRNN